MRPWIRGGPATLWDNEGVNLPSDTESPCCAMSLPNHNDAQWIIPEHVAFQVLDGQAVVLNLDSGRHFGLNEVGTLF